MTLCAGDITPLARNNIISVVYSDPRNYWNQLPITRPLCDGQLPIQLVKYEA